MREPISQVHIPRGSARCRDGQVQGQVAVAEEEEVDGFVREEVRAVAVEPFVLGAAEFRIDGGVCSAAGGGEVSGQGDAAVGVELAEQCGRPAGYEEPLEPLVAIIAGP